MHTIRIFSFAYIMLCSLYTTARAKYDIRTKKSNHPLWVLKYSPLGLFEPELAMSFAVEHRPIQQIGIQVEASYITRQIAHVEANDLIRASGFRVVPELRYYGNQLWYRNNKYIGLQASYKFLYKQFEAWTFRNGFSKLETINLSKWNSTLACIVGIQRNTHRVGIDVNMGVGLKYKSITSDRPDYLKELNMLGIIFNEYFTGVYPHLSGTVKICYVLKRNNK